ncbi:MAG: hypothetical protein K0R50_750 [Eubacterium sp.]|jgi:hypothetical protein|nr:hypothetical protein [Eubacterium sp.]
MKYTFSLPQQPDTVVDLEYSFLTGKTAVFVNGIRAEKCVKSKRNKRKFIIPNRDGIEKTLEVRPSIFDAGMNVFLNETKIYSLHNICIVDSV